MEILVNMPNRPRGDSIEIPGLGLFVNGETHQVDDEQVILAYRSGYPLHDLVKVQPVDSYIFGDEGAQLSEVDESAYSAPVGEDGMGADTSEGNVND